jgi:hypothetical protein
VDKRVRSLTKLTKDHAVADLTADYFDSVHPLPEVRIFLFTCCRISFASSCVFLCLSYSVDLFMYRGTNSSFRALLFQRQGLFRLIWPPLYLKPPRLERIRTKMMPKNQKKTLVRRHHLLMCSLKTSVSTRRGSMLTNSLR